MTGRTVFSFAADRRTTLCGPASDGPRRNRRARHKFGGRESTARGQVASHNRTRQIGGCSLSKTLIVVTRDAPPPSEGPLPPFWSGGRLVRKGGAWYDGRREVGAVRNAPVVAYLVIVGELRHEIWRCLLRTRRRLS